MTLAEILDKLERGRIGHSEAMCWLGIDSIEELVRIVHFNGWRMPGHIPMKISPESRALLRQVTRKQQSHAE